MKKKFTLLAILTLSMLIFQTSCSDDDKELKNYHKLRKSLYGTWIIEKGSINVKSNYEDVSDFIHNTFENSLINCKQSYKMEIQLGKDANGQEEDVFTDNLDNYGLCSLGLENTMNIFYNKKDLYWDENSKNKKITLIFQETDYTIYSLQTTIDKKESIKKLVLTQFDYKDIEIFSAEITYTIIKQ